VPVCAAAYESATLAKRKEATAAWRWSEAVDGDGPVLPKARPIWESIKAAEVLRHVLDGQ